MEILYIQSYNLDWSGTSSDSAVVKRRSIEDWEWRNKICRRLGKHKTYPMNVVAESRCRSVTYSRSSSVYRFPLSLSSASPFCSCAETLTWLERLWEECAIMRKEWEAQKIDPPSARHRRNTHVCSSDPISSGMTEVNPFAFIGKVRKMKRENQLRNVQKLQLLKNSLCFLALLVNSLSYISLLPQVGRLRCDRILLSYRTRMGLYLYRSRHESIRLRTTM